MIHFANVSKVFTNGYQVLSGLDFSISTGELVLLTGPSGSGKTTLFKLLLCLTQPSEGAIYLNSRNIAKLSPKELSVFRRHVSMVSQNPLLLPNESVFYNVALPLVVAGYRKTYIETRVKAALKKVGLCNKSSTLTLRLSSGEQKLTEVARAIVTAPQILLIDEPTANVDASTAIGMLKLFKAFHQIGITIIIATHQSYLLDGEQTRTLIMRAGRIHQGGQHAVESFIS